MVEKHNQPFFGLKTGMLFDSGSWTSQIFFITFIEKRDNGTWERPSQKGGKSIKFSLGDMAHILRVLSKEVPSWNTVHEYEGNRTSISFGWDKVNKERLYINGGDYHKMLNYAEIVVFKALLEHVFDEKIEHSTVNSKNGTSKKPVSVESNTKKSKLIVTEETIGNSRSESRNTAQVSLPQVEKVNLDDETETVGGVCEGKTEKALLILFESGKQTWIPNSTIRSEFDPESSAMQQFTIDTWVLKKNNIILKQDKVIA